MMELADRIEQLDGPDREIDAEIDKAIGFKRLPSQFWTIPRFTASVDAALILVPDGVRVGNLSQHDHEMLRAKGEWLCTLYRDGKIDVFDDRPIMWGRCQYAATPALAICAAAMRARA